MRLLLLLLLLLLLHLLSFSLFTLLVYFIHFSSGLGYGKTHQGKLHNKFHLIIQSNLSVPTPLYITDGFQCPDKILPYFLLKKTSIIRTLSNTDNGQ